MFILVENHLHGFHGNGSTIAVFSRRQRKLRNVNNQHGLNKEDRILIKNLYLLKGYGAKILIKKFPTKCWKKNYTE